MNNQQQNNDILLQHPSNNAYNDGTIARTNKAWAKKFEPLNKDHFIIQHHTDQYGNNHPDWSQLHAACSDDKIRRAQLTHEPNPIAGYYLSTESDGARYFDVEIMNPVQSKFTNFPKVYNKTQKLADGAGHFVDNVYFVIESNPLALLENKNNTINAAIWLSGSFENSHNDYSLSQELRGYAYEYEVTGIGCFDGSYLLWLEFEAESVEDIKSSKCRVLGWLFAHRDTIRPHSQVPEYPLRDAVYKFIVHAIRKFQSRSYPLPTLDDIEAVGRQYFSNLPMWKVGSEITTKHPAGYYRDTDDRGRLCWKYPSGEWLIVDEKLVADSWAVDDYETHNIHEQLCPPIDRWIFHRNTTV